MKISSKKIIGLVGFLLLVTAACSFNVSTAKIDNAVLVHDFNGGTEETTVFAPDETFYCLVTLANAPDDTVVKAVWSAVNVPGLDPNYVIDEAEFTGGNEITFNLSLDDLWPAGDYKVDLYLNDKLDRTLEFSVDDSAFNGNMDNVVMINEAFTARDNNGTPEATTVFAQDEIIYCLVGLAANAPSDTVVKAVWYAVNAEGVEPNFVINESEFSGANEMTFNISFDGLWPTGVYKVELYVYGILDRTLDFSVE